MTESRDPQSSAEDLRAAPRATGRPDDDALWRWVDQLERYAEAGLHARGFAHELSNVLTALQGNCELALLGEQPEEIRRDVDRILEMARRVNARLANFKQFLAPIGDAQPALGLSAAIEAAETYLSHVLRRVTPPTGDLPALERRLDADAPIAMSPPRLVHLLTAAIHSFLEGTGQFRRPLLLASRREGDAIVLDLSLEAGAEPRKGDESWQAKTSGLALDVAEGNLAAAGGRLERLEDGRLRLVLPVAPERERPRPPHEPWSFHG